MSDIQELDRKLSFIIVGNLNAHHQEWLKSVSPTDHHGIAVFEFTNLSGCIQLTKEPTLNLRSCLDLLLTDVCVLDHPLGYPGHFLFHSL